MKSFYLLLLLALLASGCGKPNPPAEAEAAHAEGEAPSNIVELTDAQMQSAGIQLGKLELRQLTDAIQVNGTLDVPPQNLASINAPFAGYVRQTDMLQGREVRKGTVMATLENPELLPLQQEYLETKARLEYLRLELERQTELRRENIGAAKTLQLAQSEYQAAQAQLATQAARLRSIGIAPEGLSPATLRSTFQVRAPISGTVSQVNVNLGSRVEPSDVLFQVVDTDHLHAELSVFEKDINRVRPGQRVRFTLANQPGAERLAKVYLINRALEENRSVRVHAHLLKEEPGLLPGTYLSAFIETGKKQFPSVPEAALVDAEGQQVLFQYLGVEQEAGVQVHRFKQLTVQPGAIAGGFVAVTLPAGTDSNATIAISGAFHLLAELTKSGDEGHGH